jgi:hypothetical protein
MWQPMPGVAHDTTAEVDALWKEAAAALDHEQRAAKRVTKAAAAVSIAALALAGCGGGGNGGDTKTTGAETPAARAAAADLKYCFEGAGAVTAKPGRPVPQVGKVGDAPSLEDAQHILVVAWPATKHVANAYYAPSEPAAKKAAAGFAPKAIQKGNVILVPDKDAEPDSDEALLASDCMP